LKPGFKIVCRNEWCCPPRRSGGRPTRLLDVGSAKGIPSLRLVEDHEIPEEAQYATLRHCWGKAEVFKLQSNNHPDMKK